VESESGLSDTKASKGETGRPRNAKRPYSSQQNERETRGIPAWEGRKAAFCRFAASVNGVPKATAPRLRP
jgi:hypothetical protein